LSPSGTTDKLTEAEHRRSVEGVPAAAAGTESAPANPTGFRWPVPKFLSLTPEPPADHGRKCVFQLLDGHVLIGELISFEPDSGSIWIRLQKQDKVRRLDLALVRMIKLDEPLTFDPHFDGAADPAKRAMHVAEEKSFAVSFVDGKRLTGRIRGYLKGSSGLFLFVVESNPRLALACFISKAQIKDVRFGARVGEAAAETEQTDTGRVAELRRRQREMRPPSMGDRPAERMIVSVDDLLIALQEQVRQPKVRLGELLIDADLITPIELEQALRIQAGDHKRRLGDILVSMGVVSVRQIQMALSEKLGIPYVSVRKFPIDLTVLDLISAEFAIGHQVLPLVRMGDALVVAVENPLSMDFEQDLRFITGLRMIAVIGNPSDLRARIAREYLPANRLTGDDLPLVFEFGQGPRQVDLSQVNVEDLTKQLAKETPAPRISAGSSKDKEAEARVTDNTLVKLVNKIIAEAHAQGASDIHIETNPGRNKTRIRFRKDGDLEDFLELQPTLRNAVVSRIKIMAGMDISEHRHAQDGKINFGKFGPLPIELRVVVVPTTDGFEDVVLRILGGVEPLPLEKLGMSERDLGELKRMAARSYGLILVCGPTGSGKTTTLHSVLHHINRRDLKIWTAEDPIEITQPGLRQVQVNSRIDWTFAAAMRAFLRADPDVIMVGEMRDAETAKIGIEASLTGHLVFSTLHTNSAAESVIRLLDLGMDPFNFADALIGILSQRLARKLCPKCKKPHEASETELLDLAKEFCAGVDLDPLTVLAQWRKEFGGDGRVLLYEPVGCEECSNGLHGRLGIYELLSATPEVKQLTRSHGTVPQLVEAARAGGMRMLKQDALLKVLQGSLDLASARAAAT
jgi:type II secretory ATPase GspE/PulE/Tfp pilus assembly ATPase PilB-like protein